MLYFTIRTKALESGRWKISEESLKDALLYLKIRENNCEHICIYVCCICMIYVYIYMFSSSTI